MSRYWVSILLLSLPALSSAQIRLAAGLGGLQPEVSFVRIDDPNNSILHIPSRKSSMLTFSAEYQTFKNVHFGVLLNVHNHTGRVEYNEAYYNDHVAPSQATFYNGSYTSTPKDHGIYFGNKITVGPTASYRWQFLKWARLGLGGAALFYDNRMKDYNQGNFQTREIKNALYRFKNDQIFIYRHQVDYRNKWNVNLQLQASLELMPFRKKQHAIGVRWTFAKSLYQDYSLIVSTNRAGSETESNTAKVTSFRKFQGLTCYYAFNLNFDKKQ